MLSLLSHHLHLSQISTHSVFGVESHGFQHEQVAMICRLVPYVFTFNLISKDYLNVVVFVGEACDFVYCCLCSMFSFPSLYI